MIEAYRSYVIRVRRRLDLPEAIRLDVEDLVGGRRAALSGDEARVLAERLEAMIEDPAVTPPGATGPPASTP